MTQLKDKDETQEEIQNETKEYPCTDTGNMERFVDQHQGYLRSLGTKQSMARLGWGKVEAFRLRGGFQVCARNCPVNQD